MPVTTNRKITPKEFIKNAPIIGANNMFNPIITFSIALPRPNICCGMLFCIINWNDIVIIAMPTPTHSHISKKNITENFLQVHRQ